ncbi:hypothetical protein GUITHDRAFT_164044 [Guillardia theta CCMP2712]|uniref:Uncharacterized protein n=1 Tax=Guillardia theta (strain CCMP2712) TaxID=905079 RepID=L1J2Y6_GUITC|nr:hypothetical protein GUITHDRAFT_164044 [Guillardia theta CCMP2712]EKX42883.1 hypothetical protein GUITHDRAFT_164044 [Guillardia theta CCMP2712]|eukprot:XP_005829863.1 hypothetical protein GUITHDRAFT_164044 [Guillardia theta CCMP2712]
MESGRRVSLEQVDAFTRTCFKGNPAAVIEISEDAFPPDRVLQMMAEENNLSETAFWKRRKCELESELVADLRWFTPKVEVDICGHATLATAHSIFNKQPNVKKIFFHTRSGVLEVSTGADGKIEMIFPVFNPKARPDLLELFEQKLGVPAIAEVLWEEPLRDAVVVFPSVDTVLEFKPNMADIASLPSDAIIITAVGSKEGNYDFVYRFFAPKLGIFEDPVTGSAQCSLVPYWRQKLGKDELFSSQVSARTGELWGKMIAGIEGMHAVSFKEE